MAIFTADDFRDDWYGYLTNQISHIGTGVVTVLLFSVGVLFVFGELPYRFAAWIIIASGYMFYEIRRQKWRGWDTIEDTVFFAGYGAGGVLYSFHEQVAGLGVVCTDVASPLPFLAAASGHLFLGTLWRYWRVAR